MSLTVGIIDEHLIASVFLCLLHITIFLTLIRPEEYMQVIIPQVVKLLESSAEVVFHVNTEFCFKGIYGCLITV